VGKNHAEALRWFRKSAEQGDAAGQNNLGLMYQDGHGVPQDHTEAARLLRQAAEQGVDVAKGNLEQLTKPSFWKRLFGD
jgi:TPR repeat protein